MEELFKGKDHGRIIRCGRPWKNYPDGKTMEELSRWETMEELSRWKDHGRIIQMERPWKNYPDGKTIKELSRGEVLEELSRECQKWLRILWEQAGRLTMDRYKWRS